MTYQQRIADLVPHANARHVEALMRVQHSTLDRLSPTQFALEAGICAQAAQDDPVICEELARSYGL